MADEFRTTTSVGIPLWRVTTLDATARRILDDPTGIRYVRRTDIAHLVACVDMQRTSYVVLFHGARLDPHDWPSWVTQLSDLLGFAPQETTRHDHDPGSDG